MTLQIYGSQREYWITSIELDLTNYCNKNCMDCSRCCDRFPATDYLSVEAVRQFVQESIVLGKKWVQIGCLGGEPTIHPMFDDVMNELRVYKEWNPSTRVWMMTNGIIRRDTPDFLEVRVNTNQHTNHHANYVSPADIGGEGPFRCVSACKCGIGLGTLGYMPCPNGTAMGRIWGIRGIDHLADVSEDNLIALSKSLCRHCGWQLVDPDDWSKGKIYDFPKGHRTDSWIKRERKYKEQLDFPSKAEFAESPQMKLQAIVFGGGNVSRLSFAMEGFCRFHPDVPVLVVNTSDNNLLEITNRFKNVSTIYSGNIWHKKTMCRKGSFDPRFFEIISRYGRNNDYTHTIYLEDDVKTIKMITKEPNYDLAGIVGIVALDHKRMCRYLSIDGVPIQCGQGGSIYSNKLLRSIGDNMGIIYDLFEKFPESFYGDVVSTLIALKLGFTVGLWEEVKSTQDKPDNRVMDPSLLHPFKVDGFSFVSKTNEDKYDYTMKGKIPLRTWMLDDKNKDVSANYSPESIEFYRGRISRREQNYYGDTDSFLYDVLSRFTITNKDVLICGSETPLYELMALEFGAKTVTVVEYNDRNVNINNVKYIKPMDAGNEKFDFIFSISSFEHDGLGRYGDPLNVDGDLDAMVNVKNHIKDDGLLFLAVPVGKDCVVWNAHRIYGSIRLPMLLSGWEVVSSVGFSEKDLIRDFDDVKGSCAHQPVFVLKRKVVSVLVFSKDRPLFMDTHLKTLLPTSGKLDVTVYFMTTSSEMSEAYKSLEEKYPWAKFVKQNSREELMGFLSLWANNAGEYVLITVDDNIYGEVLDTKAICETLEDKDVFGFTLRLHSGIKNSVAAMTEDDGPQSTDRVVVFEPSKYKGNWNYVWEMSSTVFRKDSLLTVLSTGQPIPTVNHLETVGQGVFPVTSVKKMACFNWAPVTNIFVDSWANPQLVNNPVSNDIAYKMFKDGEVIDVDETFRVRDLKQTTHVKELFLKKRLGNSAVVVVPSWNCEKWTEKCLTSIITQTYKDIGIIFIDDASDDKTLEIAKKMLAGRDNVVVVANEHRSLPLSNHVKAVRKHCSNPESVIFNVDGDDWLAIPTAIEEMMDLHKKYDVVWSRYQATDSSNCASRALNGNSIRSQWASSHLRSFKKFLFDAVDDNDFRDIDGNYYKMAGDLALMYPILEMVPSSSRFFYDKILYTYNRDTLLNEDKINIEQQCGAAGRIQSAKPYTVHPRYCEKIPVVVSKSSVPTAASPTKVFIVTFNRLTIPKAMADFVAARGCEPVFVDNNSTYPPLLEYYKSTPYRVIRMSENHGHTVIWKNNFLDIFGIKGRYIVTDCDLDLSNISDDFLKIMNQGLDKYPTYDKCGLSLEIGDLPDSEYGRSVVKHESNFWSRPLDGMYFHADTDTTFALYQARHYSLSGIRVNRPYTALHVPWYHNYFEDLSEEEKYYFTTANGSSYYAKRILSNKKPAASEENRMAGVWKEDGVMFIFHPDGKIEVPVNTPCNGRYEFVDKEKGLIKRFRNVGDFFMMTYNAKDDTLVQKCPDGRDSKFVRVS